MSKPLFKDFNSVTSKEWKQKIQVDLKGADYNDTLIWKTNEGIDVKPFYHSDQSSNSSQNSNTESTKWKISQSIDVTDPNKANLIAIDAITRGAESISFTLESENISIEDLLKNINTRETPIHFNTHFLSSDFVANVLSFTTTTNENAANTVTFNADIIGNLANTGNWFNNLKDDHAKFIAIVKQTNQLYVDLSLYQNAGATAIQQLAYALAHTNEYVNHLDKVLTDAQKQSLTIIFNVAVGSNYFFEIAKTKALRQLWATLASEYNFNTTCKIVATPSLRNKTIYDYNINMLRTTTECMSAVLGGANTICNQPYNTLFQESTEFGERISRNQLLILKKESYFNAVNNPADGTYYIENLIQQMAEKSLDIFKDIERNNGFLKQLKEGTIQRKIKTSASKEQADFNTGKITLLGTNKHPNLDDKMKNSLEKHPFLRVKKRKTLIEPIIQKRLSEQLEISRLKEE
jgi:methylmalonyl-CoA mutase